MKWTKETSLIKRHPGSSVSPRRNLTIWVALFFLFVWALSTHPHASSFNDQSRMAAVESLVQRGAWIIDESPFYRTVDRILVDGHFYSDKPPVLTFIASGVYAVLHDGFHLTLDAEWCDFDESPCHCRAFCDDHSDWAYYLLTLLLIGLPSALMLALFYSMTGLFGLANPAALLLTTILGLATPVFPYSTVFNSHVPAAACLLAGFYAVLRARLSSARDECVHRWLFVAGLLTALAFTFDLGTILFFVAFFGYAAWEPRPKVGATTASDGRISDQERFCPPGSAPLPRLLTTCASMVKCLPWSYLLGGLLPIALMAILDYQVVGNPLPPYMYTRGYDYAGSRFPQTIAGNRSPQNVWLYGLRLLFGDHGLFAFSPVLLVAVVALMRVWRDRADRLRGAAATIGLTSSLFILYFILFTDNFGGAAYGPRWYTVFIPLLFLFIAARWGNRTFGGEAERRPTTAGRLLFLALAAISVANSYQGALNPWRNGSPLLRLESALPGWRDPVNAALSGVTFEEIEPDVMAAFATRRVDKRWFDARSCVVIPPGPTWLFVDPGTPVDPALAERSGLTSGGDLACYVDLQPARDTYVGQLTTSAWISPVLVPADPDPRTRVSLPANFGGQITLLGYELLSDDVSAGAEVSLITAWRVEARLEPPLAIFIHLLDQQGGMAGQADGLGANPDGLRTGDVLLHVHRFTIAPDAPPDRYWLQVGLYNPETMHRLPLAGIESDRLLLAHVELTNR